MPEKNLTDIIDTEVSYRNRFLISLIVAELLALALFTLWPVTEHTSKPQEIVFDDSSPFIDEATITRQSSSPPPPPRPQVPIPVPNDEVIEEEILELQDIDITEYSDSMSVGFGTSGDSDQIASNPQSPPSVVRIVEPTVPDAAKKAGIKAEIMVSFLVATDGQVEEATIAEIKLYDKDGSNFRTVDSINYGLTEATLEAALQWRFRPATQSGEKVRAYTRHIFTYGF